MGPVKDEGEDNAREEVPFTMDLVVERGTEVLEGLDSDAFVDVPEDSTIDAGWVEE